MSVSPDALRNHIDYSTWASLRLLDGVARLSPAELIHDFGTADGSIVGTLAHVFAADRLWLARLQGTSPTHFVSEADRSLGALQAGWPPLMERWKAWASGLNSEQAQAVVPYGDLKGQRWQQPAWEIVLHVVNHGTHHRGQVAGFLRSLGHTPPPIDLIHYYRR